MFAVLFFVKVSSIKYVLWNKPFFFVSQPPLYALWEINGATKINGTRPPPPPSLYPHSLSSIYTLSMEPNVKMGAILFVLHYIWYKEHVKSLTWESKMYSYIALSIGLSTVIPNKSFPSHFFAIFCAYWSQILDAASSET